MFLCQSCRSAFLLRQAIEVGCSDDGGLDHPGVLFLQILKAAVELQVGRLQFGDLVGQLQSPADGRVVAQGFLVEQPRSRPQFYGDLLVCSLQGVKQLVEELGSGQASVEPLGQLAGIKVQEPGCGFLGAEGGGQHPEVR
ncbi:hypothetical protein SCYAM73S_05936 [Streptomyces cyaneofuscatus]